jgi:hypothetical protein
MAVQQKFLSELHEAAIAWADAGFAVFPCCVGLKVPACKNGLDDATTDHDQINRWWTENPQYNVGIAPARSAMYVLDVDPPLGAETLARLTKDHGLLPDTLTIRTPRGGFHYWLLGSVRSTVQALGPKLDTRGEGGYVLVPPSIVNGVEYEYVGDTNNVAKGPEWIAELLADAVRDGVGAGTGIELDSPTSINRALALVQQYVASSHVAIEGSGGDNRTYAVASECLNFGLSEHRAFTLLRDEWNPHCQPPWTDDDLAIKVRNAAEYCQNEQGAWAVPSAEKVFSDVVHFADGPAQPSDPKRSRFYPRDESEQNERPEPTWLLDGLLQDESLAMIYGPGASWKSFLALDMCLTLSAGIARFGCPERPPMDTVYVAAEGARAIERWRRPSWREAHGVVSPLPFFAVDSMPLVARPQEIIDLLEAIKARGIKPRLLVIDTVARAMTGKNENDARDVGEMVEGLDLLKRELHCTVLAIHHTGKDSERGGRGSSALYNDFDTVMEVKSNKVAKAMALYMRKQKDADEPQTPWTFEVRDVGKSLSLFEIETCAFNNMTKGEDAFSPAKVGAALRTMQAFGETRAVTIHALAAEITPQLQGESAEDVGRARSKTERTLNNLAKSRLSAFVITVGRSNRWCLPAEANDPEL